jgi:hypothetical protein
LFVVLPVRDGSCRCLSCCSQSARIILGDVRRGCTLSGGTAVRVELFCLCPANQLCCVVALSLLAAMITVRTDYWRCSSGSGSAWSVWSSFVMRRRMETSAPDECRRGCALPRGVAVGCTFSGLVPGAVNRVPSMWLISVVDGFAARCYSGHCRRCPPRLCPAWWELQ